LLPRKIQAARGSSAVTPILLANSLRSNPGGPGFAASSFVGRHANGTKIFSNDTTNHFDIIAPDPRGVGFSDRIKCDPDIYNEHVSYFPTTQAEFDKLVDWSKRFGESCLKLTGSLVKFVDTASAVRDMEAVRVALGEGKMNYFGTSYGTM
jgi:pimeloyl-ACP methyl ester carboxylesterase